MEPSLGEMLGFGRELRSERVAAHGSKLSFAALAMGLLAGGCAQGAEGEARGPNVILISIDSLRPDHLGCYGYERETSPFLDGLAAKGVVFENAFSTTSWTLPAHAALFTGLFDPTHGVVDNAQALADGHLTLAEILRRRGYHTAGFFGGPYLHPTFGLAQGFDVWESCMGGELGGASARTARAQAMAERSASHDDVTGPRTVAAVRAWLSRRSRGEQGLRARPTFLFVHLWDVHYDYVPPQEYVERFDPDYDGPITGRDVIHDPALHAAMPARDREHLIARYDAEIRFTDDTLRQIVGSLEKAGLLDEALLIVTADHGEEFFEHGGKGHQQTLFDEVLRVPLVMWSRGTLLDLPAGARVEPQVQLVDVLPTAVAAAEVRVSDADRTPLAIQGRDLLPLLRGEAREEAAALATLEVNGRDLAALRTREAKLVAEGENAVWYDLMIDAAELRALDAPPRQAGNGAIDEGSLDEALDAARQWRRFLGTRGAAAEADAELLETLRKLGYLGDE